MCAEDIDDAFAAVAREINFDAEGKTLFGDENGRKMRTLFKNTEGFEIFEFVKAAGFGEAVFG